MVLFQTAFCISFAVFLRVGEMSLTSNSSIDRIIQKEDIFVKHESNQLFIKVKCSKTDQRGRLTTLVVESNPLHHGVMHCAIFVKSRKLLAALRLEFCTGGRTHLTFL
jgi:hypothetical protein